MELRTCSTCTCRISAPWGAAVCHCECAAMPHCGKACIPLAAKLQHAAVVKHSSSAAGSMPQCSSGMGLTCHCRSAWPVLVKCMCTVHLLACAGRAVTNTALAAPISQTACLCHQLHSRHLGHLALAQSCCCLVAVHQYGIGCMAKPWCPCRLLTSDPSIYGLVRQGWPGVTR